jgi:prepilin-type N-terminal cleavage/methylation domain-containing protein
MQRRQGFTLIEMLVTLGVIGILLGMVGLTLRVPSAQLYANDVQAVIRQARLQAIKFNKPVAITWNAATQSFVSRREADSVVPPTAPTVSSACSGTKTIATKAASEYGGNLTVTARIGNGLVWLPSGLLTTCSGLPTAIMGIKITDSRNVERQLMISIAGEVSIQ